LDTINTVFVVRFIQMAKMHRTKGFFALVEMKEKNLLDELCITFIQGSNDFRHRLKQQIQYCSVYIIQCIHCSEQLHLDLLNLKGQLANSAP